MTSKLVEALKESGEDFEFYPTSKEMIKPIVEHMRGRKDVLSVLDIGCGTCNFKSYFNELKDEKQRIKEYYVIEKSTILIDRLHKDTIVLGTDFHMTTLIDKKVDVVFCNPPYSEFKQWAMKIIQESNCNYIYLIIPQRWKDDEQINKLIDETKVKITVLGSFDFLNAERQARAKVDVLFIDKRKHYNHYGYSDSLKDINEDAFSKWFDETFKFRDKVSDYETGATEEAKKKSIKSQLVNAESKAKMLVDLYQAEQKRYYEHFMAISGLDLEVLETIGIKKESVKSALLQKITSLKVLYWKLVFDELDEITSRLTYKTREKMLSRFKSLLTVDFTIENIYPLIVWVIKNANSYYNEQLIDFFKELSSPKNVKKYKSNYKVFKLSQYRHNRWEDPEEVSHYTLDYRIVCDGMFSTTYSGFNDHKNLQLINDICVIANNLGFEPIWESNRQLPKEYGKKYVVSCMLKKNGILFDYRVWKNGNTHVRFNTEFMKALNVEASRLLGWIRDKEDIAKEFTSEMAEGAEKYFKANNYISITGNSLKLLGVSDAA